MPGCEVASQRTARPPTFFASALSFSSLRAATTTFAPPRAIGSAGSQPITPSALAATDIAPLASGGPPPPRPLARHPLGGSPADPALGARAQDYRHLALHQPVGHGHSPA